MDSHLDTLLSRDLFQIYPSKLTVTRLKEFLRLVALSSGLPLNKSQIARELSTTVPTVGAHLAALSSLFLIRQLGEGYYIEDQGLANHLCRFDHFSKLAKLRQMIFSEMQQQLHYNFRSEAELTTSTSTSTSTSGVTIPFVFKFINGSRIGFSLEDGDLPSNNALKIATWFIKKHGKDAKCVILHCGSAYSQINTQTVAMPYSWIFY